MKPVVSKFLAVALALCLLPVTALAASPEVGGGGRKQRQ